MDLVVFLWGSEGTAAKTVSHCVCVCVCVCVCTFVGLFNDAAYLHLVFRCFEYRQYVCEIKSVKLSGKDRKGSDRRLL
jgi:hypothetical protein